VIPVAHARNLQAKGRFDTQARHRILAAIEAQPGANVAEVARAVGQSAGTVTYHLQLLQGAGLVRRLREGRDVRWFTARDYADLGIRLAPLLRRPRTRALLRMLRADPVVRPAALALALGCSAPTVMWHLEKLQEAGAVQIVREGRLVVARVDPRLPPMEGDMPG
jgi:predicted transcriptional regulator